LEVESVGRQNGGTKSIFFCVFNSKDQGKMGKPQTPKAVTKLYTNPSDEQRGVEYDLENCRRTVALDLGDMIIKLHILILHFDNQHQLDVLRKIGMVQEILVRL
jgi:hypothetical protein